MRFPKVSTTNINGLPLGYTEVEYLESDSTAHIDTGVSGANNNLKIEMGFSYSKFYAYGYFFSNYESETANVTRFCLNGTDTSWGLAYINTKSQDGAIYTSTFTKNAFHTFVLTKTSVSIDGSTRTNDNPPSGTANTKNIILFNRGSGTYYEKRDVGMRCYYFRIYDNDVLVRDFVPCLDSNNRPCMYDRVEGKPYYNLGTGEFSYGKKIYGVEYLESTGTQYIDTGLKGKNGYDFDYKFNSTRVDGTAYGIGGEWENGKSCYLGLIRDTNYFGYHYQNTNSAVQVQLLTANTDYTVQAHLYSGEQYYILNGTKSAVGTITGTFTSTSNMRLFSIYSSTPLYSYIKMYYCKIWDNGTLIRDYIPVKDENNVGYMLDKVTHTLYENKGTGSFVVGKDTLGKSKAKLIKTKTTVSGLPYGYTEVEYLEGNGNQYIDTGIHPTDTYGYRVRNTYTAGAGEQCAIGSMDAGNRFVGVYTGGAENQLSGAWGSFVGFLPTFAWTTGDLLDVEVNYKNSRKMIVNGTELKDISDVHISGTIENTVYLFARHYGSTITKMRGRIYSAEITNGQDVINKFIPVLDSSNRPCMYDIIEGKAYYNQGTGEFTYGPKIIPVEYLEGTGTQYIDTGITGFADFELGIKIRENVSNVAVFCGNNYRMERINANNPYWRFRNNNDFYSSEVPITEYHVMAWKNDEVYADGVKLQDFAKTWDVPANMTLFGASTSGSHPNMIYFCKLWNPTDGSLLRDFIPVKDENGIGYMFDKLTHTLYANSGTGSFVVGDEKRLTKVRFIEDTSVISEYTKLKCLISSGAQYIDTGYNPTATSTYKSTFELTNITTTAGAWFCVFGSVESNNSTFTELFLPRASSAGDVNQILAGSHNSTYLRKDYTWVKDTKYNFEMTPTDVLINGVNQGSISTDSSLTCSHSIYLFARHEYNDAVRYNVNAKIYQFNIFNNGILVRDFIPVLRNSDNKPGMYDRVTKTFFTNQGTGEFTYETL